MAVWTRRDNDIAVDIRVIFAVEFQVDDPEADLAHLRVRGAVDASAAQEALTQAQAERDAGLAQGIVVRRVDGDCLGEPCHCT